MRPMWLAERPHDLKLTVPFGVLSSSEKVFLGALYGFYNSSESAELLADAGFEGFSDLASLDEARRRVIVSLIVAYNGW